MRFTASVITTATTKDERSKQVLISYPDFAEEVDHADHVVQRVYYGARNAARRQTKENLWAPQHLRVVNVKACVYN